MVQVAATQSAQTLLLATYFVRDALCALDAASVQEVIRLGPVTSVRHAPAEVLGIVNLRGRIVTILDIGLKLGFGPATPGPETRVFIIEDGNEFIGLLVDRVGEVVEVERDALEPLPANISHAHGRYFKGVHRAGRQVVALVDVDRLLAEGAQ